MTENDCYKEKRQINPIGIMIHSTAEPGIMAFEWFDLWNKSFQKGEINRQVCVHAFLDNQSIYQYLPWTHRGWHCGGDGNNTHIGIELCEPPGAKYVGNFNMVGYDRNKNEFYFNEVWNNTVQLCVLLCKRYNLTEKDIICHYEGYELGIASNHADVMHWFPKHGEDMDSFRAAVGMGLK